MRLIRRGPVVSALAIALATRAALALVVWLSVRAFPRHALYPAQIDDNFLTGHAALTGWARWDAAHYVAIAREGYGGDNPSPHGGLGFFPLFPLLIRGAVELVRAEPTRDNLALAAIIIANLAFLVAVGLVAWWGAARFGERVGLEAALLLCVVPYGFFFNAGYSESLFLALALGSLICAERGRWWAAGLLAGLASGTRLVGLALAPALALAAYRRGAPLREVAGGLALSLSGLVAFFAYLGWRFDDPLAYFDAQAEWGGWQEHVRFYAELYLIHPRQALAGRTEDLMVALHLGVGLAFLAFVPHLWQRLDPGPALFSTLLVVAHVAMNWVSLGRYVLPAAGVYLVAALWLTDERRPPWLRDAVVLASAVVMTALAILYAHGFWVV